MHIKIQMAVSSPEAPVDGASADAVFCHPTHQVLSLETGLTAENLLCTLTEVLKDRFSFEFQYFVLNEGMWVELSSLNSLAEAELVIKVIPRICFPPRMCSSWPCFTKVASWQKNETCFYARVRLVNTEANVECVAELLVDTGFTGTILLSEYKAHQLKLEAVKSLGHFGTVKDKVLMVEYGMLQCEVLVGEDATGKTLIPIVCPSGTLCDDPSSPSREQSETEDKWTTEDLIAELLEEHCPTKEVSPIKKGEDKHGKFALLGIKGMMHLRLGIHPQTFDLIICTDVGSD